MSDLVKIIIGIIIVTLILVIGSYFTIDLYFDKTKEMFELSRQIVSK
jgi:hypothetical protein